MKNQIAESVYILDNISKILNNNVGKLRSTYPDLKISGSNFKSIWIENFEFLDNGKKINHIYTKGKLEILVHPNGRKVKESSLENLITSISLNLRIEGEISSYYKWEYKKSSGLLKKQDIDLCKCDVYSVFEITLEDIIKKELPKFRGGSKEKTVLEDQLKQLSFFGTTVGTTK
jgi:hypothetical protein